MGNQLSHGTAYNFDEEYRPKLFKRLREFTWIEPIHEMVRLDPVVFDSDIVIGHYPESNHCKRDFATFPETHSQRASAVKTAASHVCDGVVYFRG